MDSGQLSLWVGSSGLSQRRSCARGRCLDPPKRHLGSSICICHKQVLPTPLPSQRLCYTSRCENHQFKSSFDRTEIASPMRWTIKPFTFIHQHPRQHRHLMSIALRTKKLLSFFPWARHRMTSLTTQSYLIVLRNLPQSTATTSEIQGPAREIQVSHRPGRQQAPGSLWSGFPSLSTAFDELPLRWGFVGLQRSLRGCP